MPDNRNGFLSAPVTSVTPADIVISPDGSRIYTSTGTGRINVYDLATHSYVEGWQVGYRLGGIDVSADGSFLMAVELQRVDYKPSNSQHDPRTTITVYKVDTATGEKTSYPLVIEGHTASVFNDVAVLNDGTAVLSHVMYGLPARLLDTDTGIYHTADWGIDGGYGVFVPSLDRSRALLSTSVSSVPLYIYEATGRVDSRSGFDDSFSGYTKGIVAYSDEAGLTVQQLYSQRSNGEVFTNLYVYDGALDLKLDLLSLHPEWADGRISGLAFSPSGQSLFVLDDDTDSIVQLSTADWHTVRSFAVGADIGNHADGDYGSRLLVSPDAQYFTVVTAAAGVRIVANDTLANDFIGTGAADDLSAGLGDDEVSGAAGNDLLRGDAGADLLFGDAGDDWLDGGTGNDRLDGGDGADQLNGDEGNDRLDGGAGADAMTGGKGHDTYVVDDALDRVIEAGSSGTDSVLSSVNYTLPTHFEKLVLTGTSGIDGRGNSAANTITGNAGGNFLNGGSGNDVIDGGAGNDRILGALGNDTLKGGAGFDRFEFTSAPGGANVDRILDFWAPSDSIYLMRSAFPKAGANGTLSASAFHQGNAAADAGDRIVYDSATGNIFYDSDGTGAAAAMLFATVTPGTALTNADFIIFG